MQTHKITFHLSTDWIFEFEPEKTVLDEPQRKTTLFPTFLVTVPSQIKVQNYYNLDESYAER